MLQLPEASEHAWRLYSDAEPSISPFAMRTPGSPTDNVELAVLPGRRLWTHRTLAAEVLRRPPDVLFVPAHVIPFVWPSRRLPPSVVTIHDLGYLHFPRAHTWRQRQYLDWSTRWSARVAARVIAISRATADDLQAAYAIDRRKIDVIYEATVPPPDMDAAASPLEAQLPRSYALFVGTIQPRKNLVRLAQAYAGLVKSHAVPWDLVIAGGKGWLSDEVVQAIEDLVAAGQDSPAGLCTGRAAASAAARCATVLLCFTLRRVWAAHTRSTSCRGSCYDCKQLFAA